MILNHVIHLKNLKIIESFEIKLKQWNLIYLFQNIVILNLKNRKREKIYLILRCSIAKEATNNVYHFNPKKKYNKNRIRNISD